MNKITKAEVLWSRVCSLKCSYCAMATNQIANKDKILWEKGVQQLSELHCGFVAIYGAEPLADFVGLPEFIRNLTNAGIAMTLITSCIVPEVKEKLDILYRFGLRSLSVSYDGEVDYNKHVSNKTKIGLQILRWFRDNYKNLRDVACIMTANRKNFWDLPKIIKSFSEEGIWTLFDFIHSNRGQPGSKCQNDPSVRSLLFQEEDLIRIVEILQEIKELKKNGYFIHTSNAILDTLIMNPKMLLNYNWHCYEIGFPSWITIDNTGEVYCCDDFHPSTRKPIYFWEIATRFNEFSSLWTQYVQQCSGCFWNTHFDSNRIKMGLIPIEDYVHTKKI